MNEIVFSIGGIVGLLVLKYGFLGLNLWNRIFHPGRTEPAYLYGFADPLLLGFLKKT